MVNVLRIFSILFCIIVSVSCFNQKTGLEDDLKKKFEKGLTLFEKGKYARAQEQFDYIVMNSPGSYIAIDAQYYLAESLFNTKNFFEASDEYTKYIRWSDDHSKIEESRYRICECALLSTGKYQNDQTETREALTLLQEFIDIYPASQYREVAEESVNAIRNKLAQKEFEAGRLYLKLEEFSSAIIYFNSVLEEYYDTEFADRARTGIIFAHYLNDDLELAKSYLEENGSHFTSKDQLLNANRILNGNRTGWDNFLQLYR